MSKITLKEYQQQLAGHDWTYDYSDDVKVWRRGKDNEERLKQIASTSPEHAKLHEAWIEWYRTDAKERPTLEKLGLDKVVEEPVAEKLPEPPAVIHVEVEPVKEKRIADLVPAETVDMDKPFTSAEVLSSTLETAQEYLARRQGDLAKLLALLEEKKGVFAESLSQTWILIYPRWGENSPAAAVIGAGDDDSTHRFASKEQAYAYVLAKWW